MFPILGENSAPYCTYESVDRREVTKEQPGDSTEGGRENKEGEVGLREGEVERNLFWSAPVSLRVELFTPFRPGDF
jgi:hypothetical protein